MRRLMLTGAAAICLLLTMSATTSESQEVRIDGSAVTQAPGGVIKEYLAALERTRTFRAASALAPDAVTPELQKIHAELEKFPGGSKVGLPTIVSNFRDRCFGARGSSMSRCETLNGGARTTYAIVPKVDDNGALRWLLAVGVDAEGEFNESIYLVTPEDMPSLDFTFVQWITVTHPLLEPKYSCSARSTGFEAFIADFCDSHEVEYAVSAKGDELLSINMKNRSFVECVSAAGRAVGRVVELTPTPQNVSTEFDDAYGSDTELDDLAFVIDRTRKLALHACIPVVVSVNTPRNP